MRINSQSVRWAFGALAVAVAGGAVATTSARFVVIFVGVAAALALRGRALMGLLFLTVCTLGLIRRLVSGGRVDTDPLLLVPVALLAWLIVRGGEPSNAKTPPSWLGVSLIGLPLVTLLASLISDRSVMGWYTAGLYTASFTAILAARTRLLPDIRPALGTAAPLVTIGLSGYALYQFFSLPSWDRSWMIASSLRSIGLPLPGQVRVFGSMESPTPFAVVLGGLVIVLVHRVATRGTRRRGLSLVALAAAAPAFFLTGVRTGLLALLIVAFLVLIKTRRASVAILFAAVAVSLVSFGRRVIEGAGERSSVWSLDRYSTESLGSDRSLQQRLLLIDEIGPGLTRPMGSGFSANGGLRSDNMFVDLLLAAGPLAALLALVVTVAVVVKALRYDWRRPGAAWHMVAIYTAVFTMASPVFATTSGLVVAIVWGWVLVPESAEVPDPAVSPSADPFAKANCQSQAPSRV